MTWEETIINARDLEECRELIEEAYLGADLKKNAEKFSQSEEFYETLRLIRQHFNINNPAQKTDLLDLGAGNGISSVAFALNNFNVVAVEPDPSDTLGYGAIMQLKETFRLTNLMIQPAFGEKLPFDNFTFDVVYARQAMHHAEDLQKFVSEIARVLKPGGIAFTCRDHVVDNAQQKEEFLINHPFQKYYGGENAFSESEYKTAFSLAGLKLIAIIAPLDSPINYYPSKKKNLANEIRQAILRKTMLKLPQNEFTDKVLFSILKWKTGNLKNQAGRLYSFIAKKV